MMKRKNWKRTAAFVTSMTMATTMMPAELGSVLVSAAADANIPAEIAKLDWNGTKFDNKTKSLITSIKIDGVEQTNLISNDDMNVLAGKKVEITSKVPLDIEYSNYASDNNLNGPNADQEKNKFALPFNSYAEALGVVRVTNDNTVTFKRGENAVAPETLKAEILAAAGYTDVETFTTKWDATKENVIVTFNVKKVESNGQYTYSFTMPDDNVANTSELVTVDKFEEDLKVNFYKSNDDREKDHQNEAGDWTWGDGCTNYFNADNVPLKIATSFNPNGYTLGNINDGKWEPGEVIVGDTITVTAQNPFAVYVNDGNDKNNWITASNKFEDGVFKAEFTMPKYDGGVDDNGNPNGNVIVDIVKVDEEFTYSASGSKLYANSKSGSIKNAEAAKIVAKYYDGENKDNDWKEFGTDGDTGKEITGSVPNGAIVVVGTEKAEKLTAGDVGNAFVLTANGERDDQPAQIDGNDDNSPFVFKVDGKAGTYKATYTVKGKNDRTYELNYSFRIAAKDELTTENVSLALSAKKNNVGVSDAALDELMYGTDADLVKKSIKEGKVVDFMLAKGSAEKIEKEGNYQFTVSPEVFAKAAGIAQAGDKITNEDGQPRKYYVQGYVSGSTINKEYEFSIFVTDPEYGGSEENPKEISIKWRVVDYDEIPHWEDNRFDNNNDAKVSIDNIDNIKEAVLDAANQNDAAKKAFEEGKVRFQWIKAPGALRTNEIQDELDEFEEDVPSEIGDYTVYVIYDDVVQATVDVKISLYALNVFADESDLTFKYGHKFELTKPTVLKNADGETVDDVEVSDLSCTIYKAESVADDAAEEVLKNAVTDSDGKNYVLGTEIVIEDKDHDEKIDIDEVGQLNAGKYIIKFDGVSDNEDYTVEKASQILTVTQKTLDDPSIVILIDPFGYDGETHDVVKDRGQNFTVRDTDFDTEDPRYDISDLFKMTEGGKQSAVGGHDCTFTLVSKVVITGAQAAASEKAYVKAVVNQYNDFDQNRNGLVTLINGSRFACGNFKTFVTSTLTAENNNGGYTYATKQDVIAALDAHENYSDNDVRCYDDEADRQNRQNILEAATRNGLLGNFEGKTVDSEWHVTAKEKPLNVANAGLDWDDLNTTLYDNGRIHLEITRNADDKINADKTVAKIAKFGVVVEKEGKIAAPANYKVYTADEKAAAEKFLKVGMANKDNSNGFIEGGYTKTSSPVTCASQTYKVNISVKDAETGIWARPYVLYEDGTVSYGDVRYLNLTDEAIERLKVFTALNNNNGNAVRKADLDKYQTANETLIKANVKSGYNTAENKFYVYSRYVDLETAGFTNVAQVADFGIVADRNGIIENEEDAYNNLKIGAVDGLVVGHYNKNNAVLKENEYAASIKLGNAATGCWVRTYVDLGNGLVIYNDPIYIKSASEYYGYEAAGTIKTQLEVKDADTSNEVKRLEFTHGETADSRKDIVAAKAGVKKSDIEVIKTGVVADKNNLLVQDNKMILNAGFLNGGQSNDFDKAYSAKISPKETNDISVRTYTIYKIKGVEVTVYGPVKTFEYSEDEGSKQVVAVRKGSSYYNGDAVNLSVAQNNDVLIPKKTSGNYHSWSNSDRIVYGN